MSEHKKLFRNCVKMAATFFSNMNMMLDNYLENLDKSPREGESSTHASTSKTRKKQVSKGGSKENGESHVVKKKKKIKKDKDPNAPKKPLTPYMLYYADRRTEVKKVNPNAPAPEIATIIGSEWQALSDEQKKDGATRLKRTS